MLGVILVAYPVNTSRQGSMGAGIDRSGVEIPLPFRSSRATTPGYEVSNWYVSTHPNSLFVTTLIAARPDSDCRYALRNNQLTTHYLDGRTERCVLSTVTELRTALSDIFSLKLPAIANLDSALQQVVQQIN
jgi:arylamine N-acetyltransferase